MQYESHKRQFPEVVGGKPAILYTIVSVALPPMGLPKPAPRLQIPLFNPFQQT
jgi:hypothetical protein